MNNMSDKTIQILKEAGWYENRNIDIENLVRFLSERGFEVFPSVKKFLKEFGMLNIKVPTNATDEYIEKYNFRKYYEHTTDIYSALGDAVDAEFAQQFEYFAKKKLVIIGNIDNENLVLMISESGELYCDFGKLGNDAFEAFELLCTRKKRIVPWWNL